MNFLLIKKFYLFYNPIRVIYSSCLLLSSCNWFEFGIFYLHGDITSHLPTVPMTTKFMVYNRSLITQTKKTLKHLDWVWLLAHYLNQFNLIYEIALSTNEGGQRVRKDYVHEVRGLHTKTNKIKSQNNE